MIDLRIDKRFPNFRLQVEAAGDARVIGLVGPSGSGKTTLLNCLAGIETPDDGRIHHDGRTLFETAPCRKCVPIRNRDIGYVFQEGLLFPHFTVERNLCYARRGDGLGPQFGDVVKVLELEPLLKRSARTLSGGEARRVALGRALLSSPQLLLLDEPLTGLDRRLAGRTLGFLHRTIQRFRLPVIYVSHAVDEVCFLCEEVWLLEAGRLAVKGHPQEVMERYGGRDLGNPGAFRNIFLARLITRDDLGSATFQIGHQPLVATTRPAETGNEVHPNLGGTAKHRLGGESSCKRETTANPKVGSATHIDSPPFLGCTPGNEAILSIRASDTLIARVRPERISARNILCGKVIRIVPQENHMLILIDIGVPLYVSITPAAVAALDVKPGVEVYAVIKATAVSVDAWIS